MNTPHFNPYKKACPSRRVLHEVGDTWAVLIVGALSRKEMRFCELTEEVDGISYKMLTQTLRALERDGIIERVQYTEMPVRVMYSLTDFGRSIIKPMAALEKWATDNMHEVMKAREKFDIGVEATS